MTHNFEPFLKGNLAGGKREERVDNRDTEETRYICVQTGDT